MLYYYPPLFPPKIKIIMLQACINQGWTNLLLGRVILLARPIGHAKKTVAQNQSQCARLIEKLNLYRTCRFHLYCNFIKSVCNEAFAA